MRNAFVRALVDVAANDPRIVFLTADLGYKLFDDFAKRYPGRFLNVGVAEANMLGVAAGLALEGKKVFAYSAATFATLRCYEQIRNDVCFHDADVTIVGVGSGFSYAQNGPSHHALEDIAIMRVLSQMAVVCPGDPHEAIAAVEALAKRKGPAYLRLGRAGEPTVHAGPLSLPFGRALVMREGREVALLSTGNMLAQTVAAADRLTQAGLQPLVASMPYVKPLDVTFLDQVCEHARLIVTVEEHNRLGGFGSAVAEHVIGRAKPARVLRFGSPDEYFHVCGDAQYYREKSALTSQAIADAVLKALRDER